MSQANNPHDTPDSPPNTGGDDAASVWRSAQRSPRAQRAGRYLPDTTKHPARMLPELAAHAIATYSSPGDLVLDPMCGAGTSLVEAVHQGRRAVGVDSEPRWVQLARANLRHARTSGAAGDGRVYGGDARHLDALLPDTLRGAVNLVLTSPPYGPSVHGQVDAHPGDGVRKRYDRYDPDRPRGDRTNLARHNPTQLTSSVEQILTALRPYLTTSGTVVLSVRPWRRAGQLVDLPADVLDAAHRAGYVCLERCVALLAALRDGRMVARPSFFQLLSIRQARAAGVPLHLIAHEDLLVLQPALGGSGAAGHPSSDTAPGGARTKGPHR
jgi:hypothetical protein